MHRAEECHRPDPWCWLQLRLPAAAWPHRNIPCCTPHAMQSSLETKKDCCLWSVDFKYMNVTAFIKYRTFKKKKETSSSPAKSFTFTSAPSLMSSLMRRASPRIAALCSRVSPLSFLLFTLSLVLDAEFGVPFWPRQDCDWCFGVVSAGRRHKFHSTPEQSLVGDFSWMFVIISSFFPPPLL